MTQKNIWNISVKELMEKYQVTEQGLTTARAEELRLEKGENILQESRRKSIPEVFISQFADLLVVILIIAAAISMFSGNAESTIVILLVLVINAILGTLQHVKAQAVIFARCKSHKRRCKTGISIERYRAGRHCRIGSG